MTLAPEERAAERNFLLRTTPAFCARMGAGVLGPKIWARVVVRSVLNWGAMEEETMMRSVDMQIWPL